LEKIIVLKPAYDKRNPDPSKNYGIHCVDLIFALKGKKGAVTFVVFTGWYLPEVKRELESKGQLHIMRYPEAVGLDYHSPVPRYEGQLSYNKGCMWLDDQPCYMDGSVINSERLIDVMLAEGSDGIWRELEEYYHEVFGDEGE
jgi:hypothetical protein